MWPRKPSSRIVISGKVDSSRSFRYRQIADAYSWSLLRSRIAPACIRRTLPRSAYAQQITRESRDARSLRRLGCPECLDGASHHLRNNILRLMRWVFFNHNTRQPSSSRYSLRAFRRFEWACSPFSSHTRLPVADLLDIGRRLLLPQRCLSYTSYNPSRRNLHSLWR